MKATLSRDRTQVRLQGRRWGMWFPVAALPAWLNFYRRMAARRDGAYAGHYAGTVAALEAMQREMSGPVLTDAGDRADGAASPPAARGQSE